MSARRSRNALRRADPGYYQSLHENNANYQSNNWLVEELPVLVSAGAGSILEVGCGNGLFLGRAAAHWPDVWGLDWARSPVLSAVLAQHPGVRFIQHDVTAFCPERRWGLLASADVLEHLAPAALPGVIQRLHAAADVGYHKIACYDDGHSHLAVLDPRAWLLLFRRACPDAGYRIVKTTLRAENRKKPVVVISNLPPAP